MFGNKEKQKKADKNGDIRTTMEVLPIRMYDEQIGSFVLEDGTYLDLFDIVLTDRSNLQGDDLKYNIYSFTRFLRLYAPDLKFISMNFPVNTAGQRASLERIMKKTTDAVRKRWLEREIEELLLLDQNVMRKEFYLMYFGKNRDDLIKNKNNIDKWIGFGRNKLVDSMSKEKKIQIIKKICNMNALILPDDLKDEGDDEKE